MLQRLRLKRVLFVVAMLAAPACGTEPGQLAVDDVNGDWLFTLTKIGECSGVQGDILADLEFEAANQEVANTISTWSNDPDVPGRYSLIGNLDLETGATELRFWQAVLVRGFIVTGTLSADGTFQGTAVDPIPGYEGYLSIGGCSYEVTAQRQQPG